MIQFPQLRLAGVGMPIIVVTLLDAVPLIVLVPTSAVKLTYEPAVDDKVGAWFESDSITVFRGNEEGTYFYNKPYEYKQEPLLLTFLQQQNMIYPTFPEEVTI